MLNIKISYSGKKYDVKVSNNSAIRDALKKININPETVIVRKGSEIIPDTEKLNDGDKLDVLRVVSGG